ncbi:MAG: ABC transporter ATP-binding protein [Betaproteobacteria bacterium]
MLEARNVRAGYGAAPAIWDASLRVGEKDLVVVVGPNGAGKSTLVNTLAGVHRADAGNVEFNGQELTRLAPYRFSEQGIALVPEGRRLFTGMTVRENLELGAYRGKAKAARPATLQRMLELFPVLREKLDLPAGTLSGGQQQMLAIARALMALPKLLLLDEPSLGLAPAIVVEMFRIVREVNAGGVAVLLVEQNVAMALQLAHRAYVLEEGRIVGEGRPDELLKDDRVRKAYLGN